MNNLEVLHERYTALLLDKDRKSGENLIIEAVKSGVSVEDIYVNVLQPSQYRIGLLWQSGKISVSQEHFCTAITQSVMSKLYDYIFASPKTGKTFVSLCVSDEYHDLGLRMVTDMVEMNGFDTVFLGANVPSKEIEEALSDYRADVLGISVTIASHLTILTDIISRVRSASQLSGVKILVGGYALNTAQSLWKKTGADSFAGNALEAVTEVKKLAGVSHVAG